MKSWNTSQPAPPDCQCQGQHEAYSPPHGTSSVSALEREQVSLIRYVKGHFVLTGFLRPVDAVQNALEARDLVQVAHPCSPIKESERQRAALRGARKARVCCSEPLAEFACCSKRDLGSIRLPCWS